MMERLLTAFVQGCIAGIFVLAILWATGKVVIVP